MRGAAIRAEQRLAEGGGFAGYDPNSPGLSSAASPTASSQGIPEVAEAEAAEAEAEAAEAMAAEAMEAAALVSVLSASLFPPNAPPTAALQCRHCPAKFHVAHNALCRRHHMGWMELDCEDLGYRADEFPEGGMWHCCGGTSKACEGCAISTHEAKEEVPEMREEVPLEPSEREAGGEAGSF